jgi:transketolase
MLAFLGQGLSESRRRLDAHARKPRDKALRLDSIWESAEGGLAETPDELRLELGSSATLRGQLGKILSHYNQLSGGAVLSAAADLLGSTSVLSAGKGFGDGFFHSVNNPSGRILSLGGICEDGISGIMSGIAAYGSHLAVASSYSAFIAALGHVSVRLHAIGMQAFAERVPDTQARPLMLICAHAGMKTGEDGPTHADPQALQLLQDNFPSGAALTLTPWDPQELWPLVTESLRKRPAIIAPFVTRPNENILDRESLGLAPAGDAVQGLYRLRAATGRPDATIVLQGSGVTYAFLEDALPLLEKEGVDLELFYVASAELFDALPESRRREIYPEETARAAMGITGFTAPTLHRWLLSDSGRAASLSPFQKGRFLGSGQANKVMAQAGLDGPGQFAAVMRFVKSRA